jgi:S-methylmethionine-dependent homocysteine/selenocysteine methylase
MSGSASGTSRAPGDGFRLALEPPRWRNMGREPAVAIRVIAPPVCRREEAGMVEVVLLDGGMGQELTRRHGAPPHPLWSAKVMWEDPDAVRAAHEDFLAAGARVITVNAYTLTRPRLARHGEEDRLVELQRLACRLAGEARAAAGGGAAIAGCLPPLAGSYRAEVVPPFEEALALYREIVALQAPHVDLFLAETLTTGTEARAAATAAAEAGLPVWIAWTLMDGGDTRLRGGETLAEADAALAGLPVAARLANCCHPESVDAAMPELAALGGPFGGYANGFVSVAPLVPGGTVAALEARGDLGPDAYARHALGWVEAGATIVGGCCEVGPAHIAEIARQLEASGHRIAEPGP